MAIFRTCKFSSAWQEEEPTPPYRLWINQVVNLFGIEAQQVLPLAEAMNKTYENK